MIVAVRVIAVPVIVAVPVIAVRVIVAVPVIAAVRAAWGAA